MQRFTLLETRAIGEFPNDAPRYFIDGKQVSQDEFSQFHECAIRTGIVASVRAYPFAGRNHFWSVAHV